MPRRIKNQRGSLDLIFIVIFFVLAAGLGGYVYYQQRQTQQAELNAGKGVIVSKHVVAKKTPAAAVDPTAGWTAFTSVKGKFSLKYPSTWVVPINQDLCNAGMFDRAIYLGPAAATVLHCASSYFGMMGVFSIAGVHQSDYALGSSSNGTTYENPTDVPVTVSDVTGNRFSGTIKTSAGGPGSLYPGTKTIRYVFYTNGTTYVATYNQQPANPDVSTDFDTMVKSTLKFN